jgi:hypothetical protein
MTMKSMASDAQMNVPPPFGKRMTLILVGTVLLLLIPLVAMQFTEEVVWTLSDFGVAGALLAGTGLVYELATRSLRSPRLRMIAGAVIVGAFLVIWAELAVGIFH